MEPLFEGLWAPIVLRFSGWMGGSGLHVTALNPGTEKLGIKVSRDGTGFAVAVTGPNGSGGKMHMVRPKDDPEIPWTALLVYPGLAVSTAWVYKNLNLRLTKDEKKLRKFHFEDRFFNAGTHLVNDLEAVTSKAFPVIEEIKRLLLAHGAAGAMMSGSGSTVFGLFETHGRAESAYSALCNNQRSQNWALYVADLLIHRPVIA